MTDLKTGRPLTPEELVAQAQYIATLEEECAANRLVKRQMKEMYEAQIESLSRELDAFRTEYLCTSSAAPQPPVRTPSPAAMASSASAVAALQVRVSELEAELARRDEQQQQQQQQAGGSLGAACCMDSAIVLEDAQRQLDAALAALDAERRQHALDCAQSAKEEALLRRAAWKARSRELAALAKMRTLALQPEIAAAAAAVPPATATETAETTASTSTDKSVESVVVEENWALKRELCAVYARMDKLAQMFLCRLNASGSDATGAQGSPSTGARDADADADALRQVLLSSEEERRAVRLATESARRDAEAVLATVRVLTGTLERLRDKVLGTSSSSSSDSNTQSTEQQQQQQQKETAEPVPGVHGELERAVARIEGIVGEVDAEIGRTVASFSLAETLALLRQEKVRLETDVDELRNRCAHHEAERAFAGAALVQFLEADEKDKKAVLMKLAELLHLSVQDRERILSKMGAPPVPRSFLSRFSKP